ncbi:MAG: winged helix-turn-helix transcriptional regulator [Elusimicrobiota bacterium]
MGNKNQEKKKKNKKEIIEIITRNPGICQSEIIKRSTLSKPTIIKRLDELEREEAIIKRKDKDNKSKNNYYLTEKEIKSPKIQSIILYRHIQGILTLFFLVESQTIYTKIKDKSIYELEKSLKKKPIPQKQLKKELKILNAKTPEEMFRYMYPNNNRLTTSEEEVILRLEFNLGVEVDKQKESVELLNDFKKVYLSKGPLIVPKVIFSIKSIIDKLIQEMVNVENIKEKKTLRKTIERFLLDIESNFKPEEISEERKPAYSDEIDEVINMGPLDRFENTPLPANLPRSIKCNEEKNDLENQRWNGFLEQEVMQATQIRPIFNLTPKGNSINNILLIPEGERGDKLLKKIADKTEMVIKSQKTDWRKKKLEELSVL